MNEDNKQEHKYTWEEAIELLRNDPKHEELIFNSYLTSDLLNNCKRFADSDEFAEVLKLLKEHMPSAKNILDMPGGNGIATYSFASHGFNVTSVEPDDSNSVGRGAIKYVLNKTKLNADIVEAWAEDLPFNDNTFDVVYVRQGLHHAADLNKMLLEINRVLVSGGILIACREHVVDDYDKSLESFLSSQVDHQLYGGEHAFILPDYRQAIYKSGLSMKFELKQYDSVINLFPSSIDKLHKGIMLSSIGQILGKILPDSVVIKIATWYLNTNKNPGRLYTFFAQKGEGEL